jgi:hypothetical protein
VIDAETIVGLAFGTLCFGMPAAILVYATITGKMFQGGRFDGFDGREHPILFAVEYLIWSVCAAFGAWIVWGYWPE